MGHRLSRSRQRSSPRRHESLENLSPRREFHHRLRSKGKRLHPANGVGKHQRLGRHQVILSAAVLPPLSRIKIGRGCCRQTKLPKVKPVRGSAPLGSAPLGSAPLGSAPLGSAPLGSAPLPHQSQKLIPRLLVLPKRPQQRDSNR